MPRIPDEPLEKITTHLYRRDLEFLRSRYPVGYQEAVRLIVRREISRMKEENDGE